MGKWRLLTVLLLVLAALFVPTGANSAALLSQTTALLSDEAQAVYLGNLERAALGIPPLRWNRELTNSARWFAWDSVENRLAAYCGHQDTTGGYPGDRARANGYYGNSGAENAFCDYVTPADAITGWMGSDGHRGNLLDPNSREVGIGYYLRSSDGRGYVVQDFGQDPLYAPVVINNEALNTTSSPVNLYIYGSAGGQGFNDAGPTTEMRISNTPCLELAAWQPYSATKTWSLLSGDGWRTVYVQTRDAFGRYFTVSDTIYSGATVPLNELGDAQMSQTQSTVTVYNQPEPGYGLVQYSLGWAADDSYANFSKLWGAGSQVNDSQAWGGTAYRMVDGSGETFAWVWTTDFYANTPMVAYFRLKVNNNSSSAEVARIGVEGGSNPDVTRSLRGIDFALAGEYQEFALPFTFAPSGSDPFLIFDIWRSGSAEVYFDAVTIFSTSLPASSPMTLQFTLPQRYRGQTLWLRWLNAQGAFSDKVEGITHPLTLAASPSLVDFMAAPGQVYPAQDTVTLTQFCGQAGVAVSGDPNWLKVTLNSGSATLTPKPQNLPPGEYTATLFPCRTARRLPRCR
jgi:uncharacterized protein YkwD